MTSLDDETEEALARQFIEWGKQNIADLTLEAS